MQELYDTQRYRASWCRGAPETILHLVNVTLKLKVSSLYVVLFILAEKEEENKFLQR
jgi:hypothetical protein